MNANTQTVDARCALLSSAAMVSARCARIYGTDDSGIPEMADEIIALRTAEQRPWIDAALRQIEKQRREAAQ